MTLRYREAGRGPLLVMLHGFPDSPHTWRFQADALVASGFRVVTPWLRGYGESDKPQRVRDYRVEVLERDVESLIVALGAASASVIGHDWGGVIGWRLAANRPAIVERLIVLNAPHPAAFARELRKPDQLARSMYAVFFQLPWLPELLLSARNMDLVRRSIQRMVRRRDAFTASDWETIHATLSEPGALRAALAYYRAAGRALLRSRRGAVGRLRTIEVPTLLLWGEKDDALNPRLTLGLERRVRALSVRRYPDAGHWVHWDEPEAVRAEMLAFLARD